MNHSSGTRKLGFQFAALRSSLAQGNASALAEDRGQGYKLYVQYQCYQCHGYAGQGGTPEDRESRLSIVPSRSSMFAYATQT